MIQNTNYPDVLIHDFCERFQFYLRVRFPCKHYTKNEVFHEGFLREMRPSPVQWNISKAHYHIIILCLMVPVKHFNLITTTYQNRILTTHDVFYVFTQTIKFSVFKQMIHQITRSRTLLSFQQFTEKYNLVFDFPK